ncbi:MAG: hypothetical protein HWN81_05810 [Candidatus Lokiarchaeota archaeon]|nr:hypothetical protein [Candidatus Lokiarchaeota archaeon]
MIVKNIDFNDNNFKKKFVDFCCRSSPLEETQYSSLESRRIQSLDFLEDLKSSDISLSCESENKDCYLYCFFEKRQKEKALYMNFVFTDFDFYSTKQYKTLVRFFYLCCLRGLEISNYKKITAEIRRKRKKQSMISFVQRFCEAFNIEKGVKGSLDKLSTTKKQLKNEFKKLQI